MWSDFVSRLIAFFISLCGTTIKIKKHQEEKISCKILFRDSNSKVRVVQYLNSLPNQDRIQCNMTMIPNLSIVTGTEEQIHRLSITFPKDVCVGKIVYGRRLQKLCDV